MYDEFTSKSVSKFVIPKEGQSIPNEGSWLDRARPDEVYKILCLYTFGESGDEKHLIATKICIDSAWKRMYRRIAKWKAEGATLREIWPTSDSEAAASSLILLEECSRLANNTKGRRADLGNEDSGITADQVMQIAEKVLLDDSYLKSAALRKNNF